LKNEKQLKEFIVSELPGIMEKDPEFQHAIFRISSRFFAGRKETEGRFEHLLDEFRKERARQDEKWEKLEQKRAEERADQERRWWESNKMHQEMLEEIKRIGRRHDSTIGALGARWGLHSERSFRNGFKAILEENFDVEVINVNEFDDSGEVFGRPDQVELDIIVKDGLLIICEIKSSVSKADMHVFDRKARFYEKRHGQAAGQKMVISPMIEKSARDLAVKLGIKVYNYAEDVESSAFGGNEV
jgi:hypothetical protein